jgi:hypothetical protein
LITNDDWYVFEASKNPACFEKILPSSLLQQKFYEPLKQRGGLQGRNVSGSYYYLC